MDIQQIKEAQNYPKISELNKNELFLFSMDIVKKAFLRSWYFLQHFVWFLQQHNFQQVIPLPPETEVKYLSSEERRPRHPPPEASPWSPCASSTSSIPRWVCAQCGTPDYCLDACPQALCGWDRVEPVARRADFPPPYLRRHRTFAERFYHECADARGRKVAHRLSGCSDPGCGLPLWIRRRERIHQRL